MVYIIETGVSKSVIYTGVIFSSDVSILVINALLLLLRLLGGISKLVIHTSAIVLHMVSVN